MDRVRSIASVRRKRGGPSNIVGNDPVEDNVRNEKLDVEDEGYPGRSANKSSLVSFEEHVARKLCNGVVSNDGVIR